MKRDIARVGVDLSQCARVFGFLNAMDLILLERGDVQNLNYLIEIEFVRVRAESF